MDFSFKTIMINFWSWNELILANFGPKYKGEINMATITRKINTGQFSLESCISRTLASAPKLACACLQATLAHAIREWNPQKGGGGGCTPGNSWWGCAAQFSKS